MTPTTIRRQYAAEAALVGGRHWRGSLFVYASWLRNHAHVLASKEDGRAEVRRAAQAIVQGATFCVSEELTPRPPGCQCQWEAGDSPCRVHGEDET